jgi:hypothetical protein
MENKIQSVKVNGWKEVFRFKKKTLVFIINYVINNEVKTAWRSYREFQALYKKVKLTHPKELLPAFPESKGEN